MEYGVDWGQGEPKRRPMNTDFIFPMSYRPGGPLGVTEVGIEWHCGIEVELHKLNDCFSNFITRYEYDDDNSRSITMRIIKEHETGDLWARYLPIGL